MSDNLEVNTRDKIYIWISDKAIGERDIVEGNNIFHLSDNGLERGGYLEQNKYDQKKQISCK